MQSSLPTILVIGGAGYIGSHVCKELAANGYFPVCYDNLVNGHEWAVKWGPLEKGGIGDQSRLREVFEKYKPSGVVHLAAFAYVGESVKDPEKYYVNNVAGTLSLLSAMHSCNVSTIVFSSTCAVYGVPKKTPITEQAAPDPMNPYGASKFMIERMLKDFHHAYGLKYIALRYFNAAGADPDAEIGEVHSPETHLIPLILDVALGKLPKLTVFGNMYPTADGTCIRDYIHVTDLARAHVLSLKAIEKSGQDHISINLGTGRGHSIFRIIKASEEITGKKIAFSVAPPREGDPPELIADPSEAMKRLSWKPEYPEIRHIIQHAWNFHKKRNYFS